MIDKIKNWFQTHINRHTTFYALRIVIGIILSILIAEMIGIQFAPSTGVVMLLSLQATRKETMQTILRKVISLGYTLGFAVLIHEYIGQTSLEFSLVILLMVVLSIYLGWYSTLSVNVVIASHLFITQQVFTTALICNEIYRVFIGIGIAFIINLGVFDMEKQLTLQIQSIESKMQEILLTFADYLDGNTPLKDITKQFQTFQQLIDQGLVNAQTYSNNHVLSHARYYEDYMHMRGSDILLMEHIYTYLKEMPEIPAHSGYVADYTRHIANTLHIARPVDEWSEKYQEVQRKLDQEELPSSRSEFHAQVNLLYVLYDLSKMLDVRKHFLTSISQKQRDKYLKA
ncbi:MAG: aromatic acid exporter family protein [Hespellia sp.]|nr:aromatic acid exporter family protein [Hespellia sp.]